MARSDSRVAIIIIGKTRSESVKAPVKRLLSSDMSLTKTPRPRSPYIMDGTPARFAIFISISLVRGFFAVLFKVYARADSERYREKRGQSHYPDCADKGRGMPAFSAILDGKFDKNCQLNLPPPS